LVDAFVKKFAQGGNNNLWGITSAEFLSAKEIHETSPAWRDKQHFKVDIDLTRAELFNHVYHSTLTVEFSVTYTTGARPKPPYFEVLGSEVTTNGKADASLFLLQGLMDLCWVFYDRT